jgi:hypothetical protein
MKVSAKISMFRLNELGDCFLVTFTAGDASSRMLIDCGSFRNSGASVARLKAIAAKIDDPLARKPLDVVVGTHQHNDHLSGFVHCKDEFKEMDIRQVWLSWLDNPADKKAQAIGKAHKNLMVGLAAARDLLSKKFIGNTAAPAKGARSLGMLDDILAFHGSAAAGGPPEIPAEGVKQLKEFAKEKTEYLRPGRILPMPGLPEGTVRIHVLGPPRIENVEKKNDPLYRKDPRSGESYDPALAAAGVQAAKFLDALRSEAGRASAEEENYPFNENYKCNRGKETANLRGIQARYKHNSDWRTIDDDWLLQAGALALYLDTFTNNSSLVLAIELVESGKVLLFAADAQTGNWASWNEVPWQDAGVKTDDLLARTVFYKVGHHASHNATLVQAFEKMTNRDLVAFIPVHKKDPNITKKNGWKMPAKNLFKRIVEKTENRVLQMDDDNPSSCNPKKDPAKKSWKRVGIKPVITDDTVEIEIKG